MRPSRVDDASRRANSAEAWALSAEEVIALQETDASSGLTHRDAAGRLDSVGPNEIDEKPPPPAVLGLLRQFTNTMILVLLAAAVVTVFLGDMKDTVVIVAVVTLNAAVGYRQERQADRAIAALKKISSPIATVVREGRPVSIPAREVVPGDLLRLEVGDVVAADARLIDVAWLRVNESSLTGESVPVDKETDLLVTGGGLVAERRNVVFKGTAVTAGHATAVVIATGMRTELGTIAALLRAHQAPQTPLQHRLAVLARRIAFAVVFVCAIVFAVGMAQGGSASRMLLTAVSLAVAAIPESLPAVVTISLALGAQRMARQNAIIRKLPAVETLGSVTVIASDKTGTLTSGAMTATEIWQAGRSITVTGTGYEPFGEFREGGSMPDLSDPALTRLLEAAAVCNDAVLTQPQSETDGWTIVGDPTEAALLVLAAKAGIFREQLERRIPRVSELGFDAARKMMSTVHLAADGSTIICVKGAPEGVLPRIVRIAAGAGNELATPKALAEASQAAEELAQRGFRVLAVAGRSDDTPPNPDETETSLTLYGLIGLVDPLRPEVPEAVALARSAGITPVMVTGDHPATARAIACQLGIADGRRVMTGAELSRDDSLAGHVGDVAVFARTTPEQKLGIVEAWKARGEIVAMTGDGVNDAPALKRADIGVAMGVGGTEVAKEAADMVLADDNFATIVSAVREGRRIYDNIRRFVRYGLTGGSAEIWVMLAAPLFGIPLALLPAQILWVNLVTHGLPGLALGVEPAESDVMHRRPRPATESIFAGGLWQQVLGGGLLIAAISLGLGVWAYRTERPWQTMIFTTLALLQLGNAMAVRSERRSFFRLGVRSNPFLLYAVLGTLAVQIALPFIPAARQMLTIDPLSFGDLAMVLVASTGAFWAIELEKVFLARRGPASRPFSPGTDARTVDRSFRPR